MNRSGRRVVMAALAGAVVMVLAALSPVPAAADYDEEMDKSRLLVERNIFRRDRRPRVARPVATTRTVVRTPYDTDHNLVLTGIARRDGGYVAFFENTQTGATTRAATSRPVGKGEISAITLDGIEYKRDGSVTTIKVGHSLSGSAYVRPVEAVSSVALATPTGSDTRPAGSGDDPAAGTGASPPAGRPITGGSAASILEQMRRRRQQELNK